MKKHTPQSIIYFQLTFFLILMLQCNVSLQAQTQDTLKTRPKIGLVLSGGGAKGFAHIGVLKVLEEVGIRPDIITGTSMGAIMGSLYASGYTVKDLTELNYDADWPQLLTDRENLRKVAMEDKVESQKYVFEVPIKEKKIGLPSALIEGQHLEDKFSELFWPMTVEQSFDSLPIPFHCMAVDVVSGNVVEHKSGDIVRAIRSSMAIPTVFAPVEMDSMLLIDGGVSRNFPVQEAIDMGADIIIGVYVGFQENVKAEDLTSMTAVLTRSIALSGIVDAREQNKKVDILIVPQLDKFNSGDFSSGPEIQDLGEAAALAKYRELAALARRLNRTFTPVEKFDQPEKILISDIEVDGEVNTDESYIITRSGIEKGDSVSWNDIHDAIEYIHGSPSFKKLSYSLKKEEQNEGYTLVFHVKENPRSAYKLAPRYDNHLGVGLVSNFTLRNVILPSSTFLYTINIAENPEYKLDLYTPLGKKQYLSHHFYSKGNIYELPLFQAGHQLGKYKLSYMEVGYGIQYTPGLNHLLTVQAFYKHNKIKPREDLRTIFEQAAFDRFITNDLGYEVKYLVNSNDDLYYPTKGINLNVYFSHTMRSKSVLEKPVYGNDFEYFVGNRKGFFATAKIDHNWYKALGDNVIYHFNVGGGVNTNDPGINGTFLLGGHRYEKRMSYQNFIGLNLSEVLTNNYLLAGSSIDVGVFKDFYLSASLNVANFADTYQDLFSSMQGMQIPDYLWGYGGAIKYNSLIGPVELVFSGNNRDSKFRFLLNVGFPF